jgi:hypothetical protein
LQNYSSKRVIEGRADGRPITRSKTLLQAETKQINFSELKPNFDPNNAETIKTVNSIKKFKLINPKDLFKHRIII